MPGNHQTSERLAQLIELEFQLQDNGRSSSLRLASLVSGTHQSYFLEVVFSAWLVPQKIGGSLTH
jgi:hypothetical protein